MVAIAKKNKGDTEAFHSDADDLMLELLTQLGYGEGVKVFCRTPKRYA